MIGYGYPVYGYQSCNQGNNQSNSSWGIIIILFLIFLIFFGNNGRCNN